MNSLVIEQIILRTEKTILSKYNVLPHKRSSPKEKTEGKRKQGSKKEGKVHLWDIKGVSDHYEIRLCTYRMWKLVEQIRLIRTQCTMESTNSL